MLIETKEGVRWMIRIDMPEVLQIEQSSFWDAWSDEDFLQTLRQPKNIGAVFEYRGMVVGFMVYEIGKKSIELLKLAVNPDYRKRGFGRQMIEGLASKLSFHRRNRIAVDVPETNLGAQMFFKACGFRAVRILPGDEENAYRMVRRVEQ